ncbi:HET domain protein [Penicillium sp. IBT 18751x]|nr:HET domain protein [Penicillium sp. IBT 18751x]
MLEKDFGLDVGMVIEISPDPSVDPRVIASEEQSGAYIILSHQCSEEAKVPGLKEPEDCKPSILLDAAACSKAVSDAIDIARRLGYRQAAFKFVCSFGQGRIPSRTVPQQEDFFVHPQWGLTKIDVSDRESYAGPEVSKTLHSLGSLFGNVLLGTIPEAAKLVGDQGLGPRHNAFDSDMHRKEFEERLRNWTQNFNALTWGTFEDPSEELHVIGRIARVMNEGNNKRLPCRNLEQFLLHLGFAGAEFFHFRALTYRTPTWSWASVDGPVAIDLIQTDDTPVSF